MFISSFRQDMLCFLVHCEKGTGLSRLGMHCE